MGKRRPKGPEARILILEEELSEMKALLKERDTTIRELRMREGQLLRNLVGVVRFCRDFWAREGKTDMAAAAENIASHLPLGVYPYVPLRTYPDRDFEERPDLLKHSVRRN